MKTKFRYSSALTAYNWQNEKKKKKKRFLTCSCHKIYMVEAVGLFLYLKYDFFVWIFEIWGNFMNIWYFVNNWLIKVWI